MTNKTCKYHVAMNDAGSNIHCEKIKANKILK